MANLTVEAGLVEFLPEPRVLPHHTLVIYHQEHEKLELREVVPPGGTYHRKLLESPKSLVIYAVSTTPRSHSFQREIETPDQLHRLILSFDLAIQPTDPAELVSAIDRDPLGVLEKGLTDLVLQTARALSWSVLSGDTDQLVQILLSAHERGPATGVQLQEAARSFGLEVLRLAIDRRLPEDELKVAKAKRDQQVEQEVFKAESDTTFLRQGMDLFFRSRESAFGRTEKISDGETDSYLRGLSNATDEVRSFSALKEAVQQVGEIHPSMVGIVGPAGRLLGGLGSAELLQGAPPPAALPAGAATTTALADPIAQLLLEIAGKLGAVSCEEAGRRELLSCALHLVAEGLGGEEGRFGLADTCRSALHEQLEELFSVLTRDQIALIRSLIDGDELALRLGGQARDRR